MKSFIPLLFCFLLFSTLYFVVGCNSNPTPDHPTADAPQGQSIYGKYCITCHGSNGKMGLSGAFSLPNSQLTLSERISVITNGRKGMAAYSGLLNPAEIKAVAEYTLTLK